MHGDHDTIIPYTQGVQIFDAAQEPKRLWLVKGGAHCQLYDRYPSEYEEKVEEILQMVRPNKKSSLSRRHSFNG